MRIIAILFVFILSPQVSAKTLHAIFAGGCFWCVEADFDKLPGVLQTVSGYDGGTTKDPDYKTVSSGTTQYKEVVKISYDSQKVSYKALLNYFFRHIDPFDSQGQFCDKGRQYTSAVFYLNPEQKKLAQQVKQEFELKFKKKIATQILPSTKFYEAESYHQNYHNKNPLRYRFYRYRCNRDNRIKEIYGSHPSAATS